MAANLNHKTIDFEELTNHWSSGDNVYGSGLQLNNTTPLQIFNLAFSDKPIAKQFLDELIKNKGSSSSNDTTCSSHPWKDKLLSSKEFDIIKQRTLCVKATESGLTFFSKKTITTNINQTAFFTPSKDCVTIYSVAQPRTEAKKADHFIIDRWTIKASESEPNQVLLSFNANILWSTPCMTATTTIVKSKWLRFYAGRFDTWRRMIKEYVERENAKSEQTKLMEPYLGTWNKLKSFHTIHIMPNKIEYSDGSKFDVNIDENTKEIVATYANSKFHGKLVKFRDHEEIKWSNGSVWIRNGFERYSGSYIHKSSLQKYIINKLGMIRLPITEREIRFQLLAANRISYKFNRNIYHKGTLTQQGDIKWDNGSYWENIDKSSKNTEYKEALLTIKPKIDNQIIDDNEKKEEVISMERVTESANTEQVEGEMGNESDIDEEESEFEQDFDSYFKDSKDNDDDIAPSLEIKNDSHFVLINDDELFDVTQNKKDNDGDQVDEWLMV